MHNRLIIGNQNKFLIIKEIKAIHPKSFPVQLHEIVNNKQD